MDADMVGSEESHNVETCSIVKAGDVAQLSHTLISLWNVMLPHGSLLLYDLCLNVESQQWKWYCQGARVRLCTLSLMWCVLQWFVLSTFEEMS